SFANGPGLDEPPFGDWWMRLSRLVVGSFDQIGRVGRFADPDRGDLPVRGERQIGGAFGGPFRGDRRGRRPRAASWSDRRVDDRPRLRRLSRRLEPGFPEGEEFFGGAAGQRLRVAFRGDRLRLAPAAVCGMGCCFQRSARVCFIPAAGYSTLEQRRGRALSVDRDYRRGALSQQRHRLVGEASARGAGNGLRRAEALTLGEFLAPREDRGAARARSEIKRVGGPVLGGQHLRTPLVLAV